MEGSVSYSSSLRNCAMVCSLKRAKRKCKNKFGSFQCNNCKWDINQYADIDPRQAKLFVMQTDFEAKDTVSYNRTADIVFWFFILGFLFLGLRSFNHYHPGELQKYVPEYFQKPAVVSQVIEAQEVPKAQEKTQAIEAATPLTRPIIKTPIVPKGDIYQTIHATLVAVAVDFLLDTDMDNDGRVNCHDSAILFYNYYPWKDQVTIEYNKPLNHLFNCVLVNGQWRAIEPTAYAWGEKSYWMADVWGKEYDSKRNKDYTEVARQLGWIK